MMNLTQKLINKLGAKELIKNEQHDKPHAISKEREEYKEVHNVICVNVLSKSFQDKVMIEMIYDIDCSEPLFIIKNEKGEIYKAPYFESGNKLFNPQFDINIQNRYIKVPSGISDKLTSPDGLITDIVEFIRTHIELDEIKYQILARYVLMTWFYERFDRIPYLRIIGPSGTGKSRLLDVLFEITYHSSKLGVGVTPANIYRWLDKYPGTLFLDEADFSNSSSTDVITQILNGGFSKDVPVMRCSIKSDNFHPEPFNTFSPKIFACRELVEDNALESRIISINSQELTRTDLQRYLPDRKNWEEANLLRNKLLTYKLNYYFELNPNVDIIGLSNYEPRLSEIIAPLIIPTLRNEIPNNLTNYFNQLNEDLQAINSLSIEAVVLGAIINLCRNSNTPTVGDVAANVNNNRPRQTPITSRRAGSIIRGFGINPRKTNPGYVLDPDRDRLMSLARRYGIEMDTN